MAIKFLCIFVLCLGATSAKSFFQNGLTDWIIGVAESTGILDPFGFQGKITDGLQEARSILQKGSPILNVGPLDPLFFRNKSFNFSLEGTALQGSFENVTVRNFSNFEVKKVRFIYLPYPHLEVDLYWPHIYADGYYNLSGIILDHPLLKGDGNFTSETRNLTIKVDLWAYLTQQWIQISDLNVAYDVGNERINFTNGFNQTYKTLDSNVSAEILKQVQERYFPSFMEYIKDLLNHFLMRFTFEDLKNFALSFIQ